MHPKSNFGPEIGLQQPPALIDDATVARLISPAAMLSMIERAFVDPPEAPPRLVTHVDDGEGRGRTLLTMPAVRIGGLATIKLVNVNRGPREQMQSHLLAFGADGRLIAVVEAHMLTARRTAAASVLAARTLGAGDARRLAVLGAGRQARAQIEAFASALPLKTITIWARRRKAAQSLAQFARAFVADIRIAETPGDVVHRADLVTAATPSKIPLIRSADVQPGAHIDLVGGFRRDMREAEDALLARATVVTDSPAAHIEAGDLVQPIERGMLDAADVHLLGDLLSGARAPQRGDVTVFKSVGHAAEDLVAAELLLGRLGLAYELVPACRTSISAGKSA